MPHGLIASNEHGVVISADLKNYVFGGYYGAPSPTGELYVFDVAAGAASIYGVRLPPGGQGSVVSAVAQGGGIVRVTVLGASVLGLLVFSPIAGATGAGYGLALFDGGGACTFDSNQKHLMVEAAGSIAPGAGAVAAAGDTAIYVGAGIYPTQSSSTQYNLITNGTTVYQYYPSGTAWTYTRVLYHKTTVSWAVDRAVALRGSGSYTGAKLRHQAGSYAYIHGASYQSRYMESNTSGYIVRDTGWKAYPGNQELYNKYAQEQAYIAESSKVGPLSVTNQYPYAASSYNVWQNSLLVTDSGRYLS